MAKSGVLTVRLLSDTKDLEKGLGKASKQVESTGEKFQSAGKKMTVFATVPIVAAMTGATKAASDLEQSVGGVESVFGDAGGAVFDFGETAAETAGLSKRQVNEMAAVIGASLQGLGFDADEAATTVVNLEKRAADMAATFGGTTEEAIEAVASALRGERDPIEKYGVSLKQADINARVLAMGLDTSSTAAKKKSEAVAALDLIMGQTAKTEGQFAREADGAAGSMQIAKAEIENASAEIGSALLPMVAKAAGGVADLASQFGSLPKPIQNGVLALGGLVAAAGPLAFATGKVITGTKAAASAIETMRLKAMYASDGVGGLGSALGSLAVVGGITAGVYALSEAFDTAANSVADLARASDEELIPMFLENVVAAGFNAEKAFRQIGEASMGTAIDIRDAMAASGESTAQFDAILEDLGEGAVRAAERSEIGADGVRDLGAANTEAKPPTDALTESMSLEEKQAERLEKAVDKVKEAQDRLIGVHLSAQESAINVTGQFATLTETLKENGATLDINTEKGRANQNAIIDTTNAAFDHVAALKEEGASVDEVNFFLQAHVEKLKETMRQAGLSEDEIANYIRTLGLTPDNIATIVQLNGVEAAERALQNLSRVRVAQISAQVTGSRTAGLQLHSGGVFNASSPGGEGLALLRDRERVVTPESPTSNGPSVVTLDQRSVDQLARAMLQMSRAS